LLIDIKNHPAISSEYVKFLAAHASFKEVQVLKKKFEFVKKRVPEIDRDLKWILDKLSKL
jgi:hypothetical protein